VPKETQSSLANDVRDVEQAGTMQDFIVSDGVHISNTDSGTH